MNGHTLWFTGLSGSGKTTIARSVVKKIKEPVVIVDGDEVRKGVSRDLGYIKEDRDKHITRVADICKIITDNGVLNIASVVSPTIVIRTYARNTIRNFSEIYVKCPLNECISRDVKGYYGQYAKGDIKDFVGMNIPYEEPLNPEMVLDTYANTVSQCTTKLLDYLERIMNGRYHK